VGTVYSQPLASISGLTTGSVYTSPAGIQTVIKEIVLTNTGYTPGRGLTGLYLWDPGTGAIVFDLRGCYPVPYVSYRSDSRYTLTPGSDLAAHTDDAGWNLTLMGFELVLP